MNFSNFQNYFEIVNNSIKRINSSVSNEMIFSDSQNNEPIYTYDNIILALITIILTLYIGFQLLRIFTYKFVSNHLSGYFKSKRLLF